MEYKRRHSPFSSTSHHFYLISLSSPVYTPTCIHELIFNECSVELIHQKAALHSLWVSRRASRGEGFATRLTTSATQNKTLPPLRLLFLIHPLSPMTGTRPDNSQQVREAGIHLNKRVQRHIRAQTYIRKSTGLPLGTIKGKSSLATNGEGVSGWGKTCNNKDSYARLSHEPRGGRAAPQAPVRNQWLSVVDNAPRTTVVPPHAYVWQHAAVDPDCSSDIEELTLIIACC